MGNMCNFAENNRKKKGASLTNKFPAPADSLIMLSGFGGETNNISYNIYDSTASTVIITSAQIPLQVLSSGRTSMNINY